MKVVENRVEKILIKYNPQNLFKSTQFLYQKSNEFSKFRTWSFISNL